MDELRERIAADRQMISTGERPLYHTTTSYDGSAVDVRVHELPIIHLFVPDTAGVLDELKRQNFAGHISIEYENHWEDNVPDVKQCIDFVRKHGAAK